MALITCKECNAQISEFAEVCPNCGAPTSISKTSSAQPEQPKQPSYQQQTQQETSYQQASTARAGSSEAQEIPPKSWLVESILVTILCCLPFGIAGIVNASKVESRWYAGDKAGAKRASEDAARWTKIGFWGGLIVATLYILLAVLGAINGFWERSYYYY